MDTKIIQVRGWPSDLHQRVKVELVKRNVTLGVFLAEAVRSFLEKGRNGHQKQAKAKGKKQAKG